MKNNENTKCWQGWGKPELSYIINRSMKWYDHFGKLSVSYKYTSPYGSEISVLVLTMRNKNNVHKNLVPEYSQPMIQSKKNRNSTGTHQQNKLG